MCIPLAVYCVIRRVSPTNSKFHPRSGFIPSQADLVKKGCNFDTKLQSFFGASEGNRSCNSQSKKEKQYLLLCSLLRSVAKNDKSHLSFFPQNRSLPFDSPRKKIKKDRQKPAV